MEDTSFIDLLKEENLSKISIDPRLIECFKRVMPRLQAFFNANGYTSQRDYASYFKRFLLEESDKKLSFVCDSKPSTKNETGFYSKSLKVIDIDEKLLDFPRFEEIDGVLCHEFIHFLVMHGLLYEDVQKGIIDFQIYKGGFINEALTEMLTQQIYPNSHAYEPQVSMMKFANILTNNVNNYSRFLKGYTYPSKGPFYWQTFLSKVNAYQKERKEEGFYMLEAMTNSSYVEAQRCIIQANIDLKQIKSIEEYERLMEILKNRPAPDKEWMNDFIKKMESSFVKNVSTGDTNLNILLLGQLDELNTINDKLGRYDGKDVIETVIGGRVVAFDEKRNIIHFDGRSIISGWDGKNKYHITINGETKEFEFDKLDFKAYRRDLIERRSRIIKQFSKNLKMDSIVVSKIRNVEGLIKLERFRLPVIDSKKQKQPYVYVATYKDKVEILNVDHQLEEVKNIHESKFIGIVPDAGGTWSKPTGTIESGITFSSIPTTGIKGLNRTSIKDLAVRKLVEKIRNNLTNEELTNIIAEYRKSEEYIEEDEDNFDDLKTFAINLYAQRQFELLSQNEKESYYSMVIDENPKYVIYMKDGKVQVALMYSDKMAFIAEESEEIYIESGLWKKYMDIKKQSIEQNVRNGIVINKDAKGNLVAVRVDAKFKSIPKSPEVHHDERLAMDEMLLDLMEQQMKQEDETGIQMQ